MTAIKDFLMFVLFAVVMILFFIICFPAALIVKLKDGSWPNWYIYPSIMW